MKLLRVKVIAAESCGDLLEGFELSFRPSRNSAPLFDPLCLVGPNGTGKSQFLQVIAEMFQSAMHSVVGEEERFEGNPDLLFELEYEITLPDRTQQRVLVKRESQKRGKPKLTIETLDGSEWICCDLNSPTTRDLLPSRVVGYTSGQNETLTLPFLQSRGAYAKEVGERAFAEAEAQAEDENSPPSTIPEPRLLMIDYGTHLEVLVANLLFSSEAQTSALLNAAGVDRLGSFRCIIQLAHGTARRVGKKGRPGRKGVQLTPELERYIDQLCRCATSYTYNDSNETYILDYRVDGETRKAFRHHWRKGVLDLYSAFHKLAMLNDLALPKPARERVRTPKRERRFASRIPEPQDEDKVFRFERVRFSANSHEGQSRVVDYVSLSDGEHQLVQMQGMFMMLDEDNVLFLLDEPESHFNPRWRVKFLAGLLDLPLCGDASRRAGDTTSPRQDCLLTTHAPFVPSDMPRENVLIFSKCDRKIWVRHPRRETFGADFDTILEECFGVQPPISQRSRNTIDALLQSKDPEEVRQGLERLGHSVEKASVAMHLRELTDRNS